MTQAEYVPAAGALSVTISSEVALPLEPTRCATYLTVDRPVYRPGETVYFRSLTLRRRSLEAGSEFPIRFELLGPDGALVAGAFLEGVTEHGVGNGRFEIPDDAMAGSYTLHAKSLDGFFPEQRCEFQVRAYRVPRFKKSLQFVRPSYAPGESVDVAFSASRVTGGPLADATVQVAAMAGDRMVPALLIPVKTEREPACKSIQEDVAKQLARTRAGAGDDRQPTREQLLSLDRNLAFQHPRVDTLRQSPGADVSWQRHFFKQALHIAHIEHLA